MAKKPKIGVVLTEEGRRILGGESISLFLQKGSYFNCHSAEQEGSFLRLKLPFPDEPGKVAELSIPVHYVLYLISAEAQGRLGFGSEIGVKSFVDKS